MCGPRKRKEDAWHVRLASQLLNPWQQQQHKERPWTTHWQRQRPGELAKYSRAASVYLYELQKALNKTNPSTVVDPVYIDQRLRNDSDEDPGQLDLVIYIYFSTGSGQFSAWIIVDIDSSRLSRWLLATRIIRDIRPRLLLLYRVSNSTLPLTKLTVSQEKFWSRAQHQILIWNMFAYTTY
jgi:hypothetical protein